MPDRVIEVLLTFSIPDDALYEIEQAARDARQDVGEEPIFGDDITNQLLDILNFSSEIPPVHGPDHAGWWTADRIQPCRHCLVDDLVDLKKELTS